MQFYQISNSIIDNYVDYLFIDLWTIHLPETFNKLFY